MKKISFATLLIILCFFCGCANAKSFEFRDISCGDKVSDIIYMMQSQDCYLVSTGEFAGMDANKVLGFDTDGTLLLSAYVFEEKESVREVYEAVKARLTEMYGEPIGAVHQDENGETSEDWESTLERDDQFQVVWITSERLACYLQSLGGGKILVSVISPNLEAKSEALFDEFMLRSTAEEVTQGLDWSRWVLVQSNTLVAGVPSRTIYHFDEEGKFFRGECRINRENAVSEDAAVEAAMSWLSEEYGISAKESQLDELKQWRAMGALVKIESAGSEICISVSGE